MNEYTSNPYEQPNGYEPEMGWDDVIGKDTPDFVMVPAGDYFFTVTNFERARHNGSEKLPPCNKAVLTVRLDIPEEQGACVFKHNLFLSRKTEGILCEFFTAIGQRRHGETISMDWGRVVGSRGRCRVGIRKYMGKDGREYEQNEIQRFYDPVEEQPQASAPAAPQGYAPPAPAAPAPQNWQQNTGAPAYGQGYAQPQPQAAPAPGGWQPGKF